ncbi:DDB1- and CUL4-associated factor 13-like [Mizuhopecten yessoensis]|uniref:DDB1- and CUL4-associated factor 13 n=1 Tax=Mizuhopecten yessoensis TaxID=6573 RepID=A0A210PHJ3_MIZYE|nr:DDB1- and CUL4-associated factor 13-like [Mizuhopecten yessoensis]OWF35953.1 DDB1- and CUL4-associated factor 13 [Mizuhopecten yessoensis]
MSSKLKVKVLSRNPDEYLRETKRDIHKIQRNYDPSLHPFETSREYVRALNVTKLERVFAKPFVGALDGHKDGLNTLCKHPTSLSHLLSGSCDGEVRVWNLAHRQCVSCVQAHDGIVQGLAFHPSGNRFITCGSDKVIKQWSLSAEGQVEKEPKTTILGKTVFQSISHHNAKNMFATCGEQVDIWDSRRTEPLRSFTWGVASQHYVKFNPIERDILASCASDRSVILYDMRGSSPLRKVILKLSSNAIAWNPMEAFVFTVANEDYNLYTFDMRNLSVPMNIHMDHVAAVMDVDYSPTGKEFVSGSYDKCLRIFPVNKGHSREIYHTKRMQKVRTVQWTLDSKFILSGSDEMNIRIWKARAQEKLGVLRPREKTALEYGEKLKEKFADHPMVKRITRHRHIPHTVYQSSKEHRIMKDSQRRKESNRQAHSKPGERPNVPERKKQVLGQIE